MRNVKFDSTTVIFALFASLILVDFCNSKAIAKVEKQSQLIKELGREFFVYWNPTTKIDESNEWVNRYVNKQQFDRIQIFEEDLDGDDRDELLVTISTYFGSSRQSSGFWIFTKEGSNPDREWAKVANYWGNRLVVRILDVGDKESYKVVFIEEKKQYESEWGPTAGFYVFSSGKFQKSLRMIMEKCGRNSGCSLTSHVIAETDEILVFQVVRGELQETSNDTCYPFSYRRKTLDASDVHKIRMSKESELTLAEAKGLAESYPELASFWNDKNSGAFSSVCVE